MWTIQPCTLAPLRRERKQSSLAPNPQIFCIGYDRDLVVGLANQTIRGTKNLDWANEIKHLYRRHYNNDDSALLEARTSMLASGGAGRRQAVRDVLAGNV